MTSLGLFEAKLEAFETRMDAKLCTLFEEFRLGRSPSPRRSQYGTNSDYTKKLSEIRSEDKIWQPYTSTTSISFVQLQEGHLNQDAQSIRAISQPKAYKPSAPINYKNLDEELTKIHQTSTIQEYQIRFERHWAGVRTMWLETRLEYTKSLPRVSGGCQDGEREFVGRLSGVTEKLVGSDSWTAKVDG
ncbi:hypothetical protein B296_00029931 [Ensete ventricosum]|uniref:Retrotransposon gag domain-containing protein n=1 Tax=Ensete ventricosum TaxID=4639 RepID=A0A426XA01_ENSVE|nr:hypothetical protein B296_00029931 [Ensete ventricosum]